MSMEIHKTEEAPHTIQMEKSLQVPNVKAGQLPRGKVRPSDGKGHFLCSIYASRTCRKA